MNKFVLGFVGVLSLAACNQASTPTSPVTLSGMVSGSSSQVTWNGKALSLAAGGTITVDDEPGGLKDIQPGVEMDAKGKQGANGIEIQSAEVRYRAKGQADEVNTSDGFVVVIGVKALVSDTTVIAQRNPDGTSSPLTLADLATGDYLRVSGAPLDDDSIRATRIERKVEDNLNKAELRIRLRDLDAGAKTFKYGLKTYLANYTNAEVKGLVKEGACARVRGVKDGTNINVLRVRTDEGAGQGKPKPEPGSQAELRGPIANLDATAKTFTIFGTTINYANAEVKGTLADDAVVEVEGTPDASNTSLVNAREVKVRGANDNGNGKGGDKDGEKGGKGGQSGEAKLEGVMASVDAGAKTFAIGTTSVSVTSSTKYEVNDLDSSSDAFWAAAADGKGVEVKGTRSGMNVTASKIELK